MRLQNESNAEICTWFQGNTHTFLSLGVTHYEKQTFSTGTLQSVQFCCKSNNFSVNYSISYLKCFRYFNTLNENFYKFKFYSPVCAVFFSLINAKTIIFISPETFPGNMTHFTAPSKKNKHFLQSLLIGYLCLSLMGQLIF